MPRDAQPAQSERQSVWVECADCGESWTTDLDRPQCPVCGSRLVIVISVEARSVPPITNSGSPFMQAMTNGW